MNFDLHCHSNVSDGALPPAEVALQPNGRAVFYVSYTGIQATDKACVTSKTLRLTPPGNTQAIEAADVVAPCTDHITLGPVRADPGDAALAHLRPLEGDGPLRTTAQSRQGPPAVRTA